MNDFGAWGEFIPTYKFQSHFSDWHLQIFYDNPLWQMPRDLIVTHKHQVSRNIFSLILKWPDCFVGHSCPGGIFPESGPLSLTCSIITMLGTLLTIDTWHICFHWYIFPSKCVWKACFPILLAQGEISAPGSMPPSRWLIPSRKKQNRTGGDPALHLNQARGHLNWRMGLPALLGGNLGCRIVYFPLILHSLWGVA